MEQLLGFDRETAMEAVQLYDSEVEPEDADLACVAVGKAVGQEFKPRSSRPSNKRDRTFPASPLMQSWVATGVSRPGARRMPKSQRSTFDLVLINSSGKPQLLAALESNLGSSVFLCQEHHAGGPGFADLKHEAKQLGWTAEGAPACRTSKEGWSAGVAIVAKKGVGVGNVSGGFDHSLEAPRGA